MTCKSIISIFRSFLKAAKNFRPNSAKKESRSPRGFLPRPLLRAGETIAPPPYPQKSCGGAHQISSSGFSAKKVRILSNKYRIIRKGACVAFFLYDAVLFG